MRKVPVFLAVLLAVGLLFQCFAQAGEAATVVKPTRPDGTATVVSPSLRASESPVVVLPPPRLGGIPEVVKPSRDTSEYNVVVQPQGNVGGVPSVVQPRSRSGGSTSTNTQVAPRKPVPVPVALVVTPSSVKIEQGKSTKVSITLKYSDGSVADVTNLFSLNAGNAKLEKGVVTGLKPSKGAFILSYGNLKATLTVEVTAPAGFGVVTPPNMASNTTKQTIRWTYNGSTLSLDVAVPVDLLRYDREIQALAEKCRTNYGVYLSLSPDSVVRELMQGVYANYNVTPWVTEKYNYGFLSGVANQLKSKLSGLDRYQVAQATLAMVQNRGYRIVNPPQLPVQTLVEGGDCDALSVLYAALLKSMGYDVALFYYRPGVLDPRAGHMLVGVALNDNELPQGGKYEYVQYNGKKYYFAETTSVGWRIGQNSTGVVPSAVYVVN